jgi:small-conductance mechanosensitive channel
VQIRSLRTPFSRVGAALALVTALSAPSAVDAQTRSSDTSSQSRLAAKKRNKKAEKDDAGANTSDAGESDAAPPDAAVADAALEAAVPPPASAVAPPPPAAVPAPSAVQSATRPAPPPAASADAKATRAGVQVGDKLVYEVRAPRAGQSAIDRARAATKALKTAIDTESADTVRVEKSSDSAIIYAGKVPIIQLGPDDAARSGDASLEFHADRVATLLRDAIRTEQKRSAIATTVFSVSLSVLFALIALYLLRKTSEFTTRARSWITLHRNSIPGIRVKSLEVVGPAALRSSVVLAVEVAKWLTRFGIVYLWLLVTLSLFASTRGYTERLTGFVLSPLSGLAGRLATSLPVLLVAIIAIAAVVVLLRFITLFFASVERGETSLSWVPADLARPTSVLIQIAVVVLALVFAAPVVTGDNEGALSRIGAMVLVALGLASTPILACGLIGIGSVFARRLRVGDFAEFGGRFGRVRDVGLLEVTLETEGGSELRVPQLMALFHPTIVHGAALRRSVEVAIASNPNPTSARELLLAAAATIGERPSVELVELDGAGATFEVSVYTTQESRTELYLAIAAALHKAGLKLSPRRHKAAPT